MDEATALQSLRRRDEDALAWFIRRYTPYVGAVASGILGPAASVRDKEEICADVFFALWQNADSIDPGKVKAWLSAAARNKARDRLRKLGRELPLEEDVLLVTHGGVIAAIMAHLFPREGKSRYQWQPKPFHGYLLTFPEGGPVYEEIP